MPDDALRWVGVRPGDSLATYDLSEIVIASGETTLVSASTIRKVSLAEIARQDPSTAADIARLIPSAHIATNSRGETLVYLRNAGERQVAFFFDGALLNVPWDNRVDLSLVPASVLGGMNVSPGAASVLYGANVAGGAVNLISRSLGNEGTHAEITLTGGYPRSAHLHGTFMRRSGGFQATASAGLLDDAGEALAEGADLPFHQQDDDLRTNTDRRVANLYGQVQYQLSDAASLGASIIHIDAEKGIAPESHLDPAEERARFWRYPVWRHSMLILNGDADVGGANVRGTVWGTRFQQDVAQYAGAAYDELESRQLSLDWVAGSRLIWTRRLAGGAIRMVGNALTATHLQEDLAFEGGEGAASDGELLFGQHLYGVGAEFERVLATGITALVGGSVDRMVLPRTGDKPRRDPFTGYGTTIGLTYQAANAVLLRLAAGRKARFPTLRELFGEALDRFRVNPDLTPETSLMMEIGSSIRGERRWVEFTAFASRTRDAIDQVILDDGRRMRVNLDGSRTVGAEVFGRARLRTRWFLDGHVTWLSTRGYGKDGRTRPVPERPRWLGTSTVGFEFRTGLSVLAQAEYTGRAYSLDPAGGFEALPSSLALNVRAAYRGFLSAPRSVFAEWFLRIDNLTDAVVVPQLGLPAAGREIVGGVTLTL